MQIAEEIKGRIRAQIGEWVSCSIGISYNKAMAKLAGSLFKPDGLAIIEDEAAAVWILDRMGLDDVCGIGPGIKKRLNNMGVFDFPTLRKVSKQSLAASFKSYGNFLYDIARGTDNTAITPFYQRPEVKSIGHRHTLDHDSSDQAKIRQVLLKLAELTARRLRAKHLTGKTVSCWYRTAFDTWHDQHDQTAGYELAGRSRQVTIPPTQDGWEIFDRAWQIFLELWGRGKIRMISISVSGLEPLRPHTVTCLEDKRRAEKIIQAIDSVNDRFGEFTLKRAALLGSTPVQRKVNPYLADYRFKI